MYTFFEYCFYRIHFLYVHKKIASDPNIYASGLVSGCQLFNVLTIINIFQIFTNSTYDGDIKFLIWSIALPIFLINYFILLTEKKYIKLKEKYKEENNRKLKGWGVALYESLSILIYPCIRILFF
jgi:hypothetical protein